MANPLPLPPGFVEETPAAAPAKLALPPGFVEETPGAAPPTAPAPADGDVLNGVPPDGFHSVTIDGKQILRKNFGVDAVGRAINDLPGAGLAAKIGQTVTDLGGKAVAGISGILAGGDAGIVQGVRDETHVELPPSNDPVLRAMEYIHGLASRATAPADRAIEASDNPLVHDVIPAVSEGLQDVATLAPVGGAVKSAVSSVAKGTGGAVRGGARAVSNAVADAATGQPRPITNLSPGAAAARSLGLKLRPSDAQAASPSANVPGMYREALHNPASLKNEMIRHNQTQITPAAGEDIGIKSAHRLDETDFNKQAEPHKAKYDEVGVKAGKWAPSDQFDPELLAIVRKPGLEASTRLKLHKQVGPYRNMAEINGPDAIKEMSALRRRASKQIQSDDVTQNDVGFANRDIADVLEKEIGRRLAAPGGDPALLKEFQAARTSLAKIHDVETATRGGQVDPQILAKLQRRGAPLTGRVKMIADAAEEYPHVMKHSSTTASSGVREISTAAGFAKDAGSALIRKIPGMDVRAPSFQNKFGPEASAARRSTFENVGVKQPDFVDRDPRLLSEQLGLDAAQPLDLAPPPGIAPQLAPEVVTPLEQQINLLGEQLGLIPPPGVAPAARGMPSLSEQLGLGVGEPLDLKPSPGRVGKHKPTKHK